MPKKHLKHGRSVAINRDRLMEAMNHRGLSVEALAGAARVSTGTVNNILSGKAVLRSTAADVADALELNLAVLLNASSTQGGASTVHEYLVADVLTDWITASNGLRFQLCRLRHMELDRQARGKRFDLRDLPTVEEQRCRTWIKRHPTVCEALNEHPNIVRNLTAFHDPVESFYWVIDEWVEGHSLQRSLRSQPVERSVAKQIILDIARGLKALHDQCIIRRELNPATIMIRSKDGRAILTEFELAKLIDRGPTVSTDAWPVDPYRAGEADGDDVDFRADVYSWARIGIHILAGELPEIGTEDKALANLGLPSQIRDCLVKSSAVFRSERPESVDGVLRVVERWR